jgi:hypothetical protein
MMPNALKLRESVEETAQEVPRYLVFNNVLIPASSGTIAAGVIRGMRAVGRDDPNGLRLRYLIHLGYSRSADEVRRYLGEASGVSDALLEIVDEGYAYRDRAKEGPDPGWPCNAYYDLKTFRWWLREGRGRFPGRTLFWNVG